MVGPELALLVCAAGSLVRLPCLGMKAIDREVPMDNLEFISVAGQELCKGLLDLLTERTVKILELDDGYGRLGFALKGSTLHFHIEAKRRRRLKVYHNLCIRAQGVKKFFPLPC